LNSVNDSNCSLRVQRKNIFLRHIVKSIILSIFIIRIRLRLATHCLDNGANAHPLTTIFHINLGTGNLIEACLPPLLPNEWISYGWTKYFHIHVNAVPLFSTILILLRSRWIQSISTVNLMQVQTIQVYFSNHQADRL